MATRTPAPLVKVLGGRLGALLADHMRNAGFIMSGPLRRSVLLTAKGSAFLRTQLDLHL